MKEETKKKLCKISKIVGFAITFGFAVFGALCAAMLIGNGSKKDDIKTLDTSLVQNEVRSERNIKPRKAPDYTKGNDLLEDALGLDGLYVYMGGNDSVSLGIFSGYRTYALELPVGYYYLDIQSSAVDYIFNGSNSDYLPILRSWYNENYDTQGASASFTYEDNEFGFVKLRETDKYSSYFYNDAPRLLLLSGGSSASLYLVDTLDLPSTSSVYLGENWNPLKAFGDTLSDKGGYLLTDETWTYGSQTYKSLSLSGLLFKYEGVVYDRIQMHAKPLNALHYPYVDSSGTIVESPSTQNSGPNEIYVLDYVGFAQSWLDDGTLPAKGLLKVMVGGKADTPSASGKLPYNGSLEWVTSARSIQIIDNKGTTTGRYENRFSYMTDLEFINMLSEYESEAIDVVNNGQMFGLFTNAFDSLLPILSIAILPNISLGMLLFIPLIGAIIVIVIRVVKK